MIWAMVLKGGPLMIPILAGSIIGVAIVIERGIALFRFTLEEGQTYLTQVLEAMRQGQIERALALTEKLDHPVAPVLHRGLEQWGLPVSLVERTLEQAAQQQVRQLERWLGGLASVITIEPMLGFLGTIMGLIRAFMAWEAAGARVTVSQLAGGMYEAMITTAAGLIIAIPLLMAYNGFVSQIRRTAASLTDAAHEYLELYARLQPKDRFHEDPQHPRVLARA